MDELFQLIFDVAEAGVILADKALKVVIISILIVAVVSGIFVVSEYHKDKKYEAGCHAAGGQVYNKKDSSEPVCLKDKVELQVKDTIK